MDEHAGTFTVFADFQRHVHTGTDLAEAVSLAKRAYGDGGVQTVVLFDDATGDRTEIDPGGGELPPAWAERLAVKRAGPGRPKLGVVSREVSLLPRHWEWLNAQPSGASAALRRLVDDARRRHAHDDDVRAAKDAAYKTMSVLGGDRPQFEEAARALYAGRFDDAIALLAAWPDDVRAHVERLLRHAATASARATAHAAQERV